MAEEEPLSGAARTTVVVTGASGFVGRHLVAALAGLPRFAPRAALRPGRGHIDAAIEQVPASDLSGTADWSGALRGAHAVVHLAARVHQLHDTAADPLAEFRRVNTEGTLALARQAADAGVRRFVFLSSIKVNGERTQPDRPFRADDPPHPMDPYALSKFEAEQGLRRIGEQTGMQLVIVRPTLIYGPGVGANFLAMLRIVQRGWPMPLGAIDNRRSLLAVQNLTDLLIACLEHPSAAGQVLMAADGEDLSTTQLLRELGAALGRPARLVPVPAGALRVAARLLGKPQFSQRLCDSLQADIGPTRALLDWRPPLGVREALRATAEWFRSTGAPR